MEEEVFIKKEKNKLIIAIVICLIVIVSVIGYTYSFFAVNTSNNSVITGTAASLSLTVTVTKESPSITGGLIPQLDAYITSAVTGRKGSCIDDNNNPVCQVYKIHVKNNSGITINVDGTVELDAKNNPNLKWAIISGLTTPTVSGNIKTYNETTLTSNETYTGLQEKDYYIVTWISETGLGQTDTGVFSGVVTFGDTKQAMVTLTNLNLTDSIKKGIPDFSKTSCSSGCEEATVGIYSAEDDLGTSYYFRGDVTNNYVKFGKNSSGTDMYWRIVRINGDGSIRLIYDGTSAHANGEANNDRCVGESAFNENYDDNAYVGYMYGTAGASTYEATHANTNDSTIKTYLDDWYKTNIVDTGYSSYVTDAIYCNDRSVDTSDASYTGIGITETYYAGNQRIETNTTPILTCPQANDKFTVSSELGNGKLTYPVGLITIDEAAFAGGKWRTVNRSYYLYMGNWYWTMTPRSFSGSSARAFFVDSPGAFYYYDVYDAFGVRPSISLSSSAITGGTGSSTNPFTVSS